MILERKARLNLSDVALAIENGIPTEKVELLKGAIAMLQLYNSAIREISTKLEILDDEFHIRYSHNPIHHIESRLKQPRSAIEKLKRRGYEINAESAMAHLTDIAGIRVVCCYISDVYQIAETLLKQSDITLIKRTDYIKEPKPNGYRSLHIVVSIPVFLLEETKEVPVEIQIRTIAMDFWASLEHQLKYKSDSMVKESLQKELLECAKSISVVDNKMQDIYKRIQSS